MSFLSDKTVDNAQVTKSSITRATTFLNEHTDPNAGLQNKYIGTSRHELNQGSPFPRDIFTNLMALDLLRDSVPSELVDGWRKSIEFSSNLNKLTLNYFYDNYTYILPDDVDATSVYYLVSIQTVSSEKLRAIGKQVLQNICPETGVIQTYFPPRGLHLRTDECANANCMRLLYTAGLGESALATENDLFQHLCSQKYLKGTRYYASPDTFLYFLSRAVSASRRARSKFMEPLLHAIKSRMGATAHTLDSAQRILALYYIGAFSCNSIRKLLYADVNNLLNKQGRDGGWERDSLVKLGQRAIYKGGREISTVFALAALLVYEKILD